MAFWNPNKPAGRKFIENSFADVMFNPVVAVKGSSYRSQELQHMSVCFMPYAIIQCLTRPGSTQCVGRTKAAGQKQQNN